MKTKNYYLLFLLLIPLVFGCGEARFPVDNISVEEFERINSLEYDTVYSIEVDHRTLIFDKKKTPIVRYYRSTDEAFLFIIVFMLGIGIGVAIQGTRY